jgi:hypothetical protein
MSCGEEDRRLSRRDERGSRVGTGLVVAIVFGVVSPLAMTLAGCPSMSRAERTLTPAAAPTAAPEVPAPDVPRPELDRGQAAPGNVGVMR